MEKTKNLTDRLNKFYLDKNPDSFIVEKFKILKNKLKNIFSPKEKQILMDFQKEWPKLIEISEKWINIKNNQAKTEFLWNK